jgi:hypothetical protein
MLKDPSLSKVTMNAGALMRRFLSSPTSLGMEVIHRQSDAEWNVRERQIIFFLDDPAKNWWGKYCAQSGRFPVVNYV